MKRDLVWWLAIGLFSVIMIGLLTRFQFHPLVFQNLDTYYVIGARQGIILLIVLLFIGRYAYLIVDLLTNRYKILAVIVSIINPIAGLFVGILLYFSMSSMLKFERMFRKYQEADFSGHYLLLCILIACLVTQIIVEINMIRKLKSVLD